MTPLSGKSIVVLKSAAVKPTKEVRAAFCFYPGSGVMEEENHASFWPPFSGEEANGTCHCYFGCV